MIRSSMESLLAMAAMLGEVEMQRLLDALVVFGAALLLEAEKVTKERASMIWYLLYPFRGTTEPPKLNAKHPIRSGLTSYGTRVARHPIITLLISLAVASVLIYPIPFLYTSKFANGASSLPNHVWTSAQPFDGDSHTRPDVVMRSLWIHGSYMKALEPDVLQTALEIQNEILGSTLNFNPRRTSIGQQPTVNAMDQDLTTEMRDSFHAINGLSNSSWFFHSPLLYWGCSKENIASDHEIIQTVNNRSSQSTSVNVTLRHSIVFSGKRFENRRLVAADALVITLVHMLDSPVGRLWEKKAQEIAQRGSNQWRIIPPDPKSHESTLYEFRFQPLSLGDDVVLSILLIISLAYYYKNVRKMRALNSRAGLITATLVQLAVSTMSSFTICAILKIDLSKIPREYYTLVIFYLGSQNICKYIDNVIMTPSDRPTSFRIGEALGEKGHIPLASLAQNIGILWILSTAVYPPAAGFITFLVLALILDYFFLLTFFTAVLSIDVRRTELSDSLNRVSVQNDHFPQNRQPKRTWWDTILNGEAPASTRLAGTVVMVGTVFILDSHFVDGSLYETTKQVLRSMISHSQSPPPSNVSPLSVDIHQARTPTAWLRMQDHETAHEVIKVIKPHASRYIARVYDPIVFVMNGSDRTPNRSGVRLFLPAAYDFARNQFGTLVAFVLVLCAAVALLMHYLLWDESPEVDYEDRPDDDPLISVKTLTHGHSLDIALIKTSNDGIIVTVGLDRRIRVWDIRNKDFSIVYHHSSKNPFPVLALAIDRYSKWMAILSAKNQVLLWNIPEKRWGPEMSVDVKGRTPASFGFGHSKTGVIDPVLIIRHNGMMTELNMEANESKDLRVCHSPLVCVRPHFEKPTSQYPNPPLRIITSSKKGCVHVASLLETGWTSEGLDIREISDDREIRSVLPLPVLSSFLAVRDHTIDLIDIFTHRVTHTFETKQMKPESLRCFHSTRRRPQCGSVGLASLALVYTDAETGSCILQSYLPQRDGDTICFRDPFTPGSKTCCLWRETVENRFLIENPGEWRTLPIGYVVGVRKRESAAETKKTTGIDLALTSSPGLRRRGAPQGICSKKEPDVEDDVWEAWSISAKGDRSTTPLSDGLHGFEHLLVSGLGPMEIVGRKTIAVALGNVVKVVTVGHDRFDDFENDDDATFVGMPATSRKKKHGTPQRKRTNENEPI
ncbi:hypothetical protein HYFRA_00005257 [Hymenoscyphus fraxineus]|uniref:Sterol regulatory element-binding protein cleavage-activating protein n=1 Tax=Hymenoscyphus fraxineus TaxID=746836 RepID=A0A9N9LDI6_9HELO|nr:hypothetical protein HYFRA_00005257 [Hymenoscyphus fraxineus]